MYKVPEKYRVQHGQYSTPVDSLWGLFFVPIFKGEYLMCIASNGNDEYPWEHVSVSLVNHKRKHLKKCPTWNQMCQIKDLFWQEEDTVIQFHPPKSEYVNAHDYCLHLWRKQNENLETPPSELIGPKS